MTKYIDAEKLKSKVKELNITTKTYEEQVSFSTALLMVTELIDSLQQEQQEVDLEKEIDMMADSVPCRKEDIEYIVRHFYELKFNARKKMKQYVKIDRKVLFEICDAILEHDGYADENFCPENDDPCYWHYWDKDFRRKVENIRKNS